MTVNNLKTTGRSHFYDVFVLPHLCELKVEALFEEGTTVAADAETIISGLMAAESNDEGIGSSYGIVVVFKYV